MKCLASILVLSFSMMGFSALASTSVGFEKGNEFIITPAEGRVFVQCSNPTNPGWGSHYCSAYFSNPGTHAKIINKGAAIDADKVTLVATHADGSTREKKEKFDADNQISGAFNIAIRTLTQKPLLETGTNTVDYNFTKDGKTVQSGQFEAVMVVDDPVVCEDLSVIVGGNCNTANACNYYWSRQPRCE